MRFSTALLALASAAVAVAQHAIISKGLLIARDTSDPNAQGPDIFKYERNHLVAVCSILHRAAESSRYAPNRQDPTKVQAPFYEFQYKAASFAGFDEYENPHTYQLNLNGGLEDLEHYIKVVYHSYDQGLIAKTLAELVPKRLKNPDLKSFILSLVTVNKNNNSSIIKARLINLSIRLQTNKEGEVVIPEQKAYLYARELIADPMYLKNNAEALARHIEKTSSNDFKQYFSTRAISLEGEGWFDFEETPLYN
ncbi:hypothetical protein BGW41_001462 [Actinomortierella wolfii]|nr:hypothetical protein BGW41_001462 [Actinomortierella wolfii]